MVATAHTVADAAPGAEPLPAVISVTGLRKRYGGQEAVAGVDLRIGAGEVFAILGPNGAGKTTTVEILEGYRRRDGGSVSVLGTDPAAPTREWRGRIGIVLQSCRLPDELTVSELVEMYAGYYPRPRSVAETIELVGLGGAGATRAGRLSGGQQRRLDVALALIGDPELIFLDEPTTGFDPAARRQAWEVVRGLARLGKTVLLTTHYLEEAEALADRVAVIVGGRIVAEGPPRSLAGRDRAPSRITVELGAAAAATLPAELLQAAEQRDGVVSIRAQDPADALHALIHWSLEHGVRLEGLEVRRPSLEDTYLELLGGPS